MHGLVKARYLLLWFFLATLVSVVVTVAFAPREMDGHAAAGAWSETPYLWWFYGFLIIATGIHARAAGVGVSMTYGPAPDLRRAGKATLTAVPLVGVALVCTYGFFAPLSLVWPDFVEGWLLEDVPTFYEPGPPYPFVANLLGIGALVLLAPIVEEWFFRGLLLRRWTQKWSPTAGVIGSSVIFGVLHLDPVGAFIFGVAMCGLYSRHRSLWVPTIVHIANNASASLFLIIEAHASDKETYSIEEFRGAWWILVVGLLLVAPWLRRLRRTWEPISTWRFGSATPTVHAATGSEPV